tara:strand:- start:879 stop:1280 length:402 start_codon:yes stop_codon:yes gene_type:complete
MGILDTYSNSNFGKSSSIGGGGGGGGSFGYTTIGQVVDAYNQNKITYAQAYRILMDQFGLSDNDINDVLIAEQQPKPPQQPIPGLPDDSEDEEEIPDTSTDTDNLEITPMTDDQRFLIIGLAVAAALFGFIKK